MKATFGRTGLILGLLSLSLAIAVSIGLKARYNGVTVQAHIAAMYLQGDLEAAEGAVAPDADENDKTVTCAQRASHCPSPTRELAFALSGDRQPQESKAFVVPGEQLPPKSND